MLQAKQLPSYRIFPAILLMISMLAPTTLDAKPATSSKKAIVQQKRSAIKSKIQHVRVELRNTKKKEQKTKVVLNSVENRLRAARGQLQFASVNYQRSKIELHRATISLGEAKKEFSSTQQEVCERLATIYKRGEQGYLDLLVSAEDYGTLMQREQMARFMMAQDREALEELKTRRDRVARYQDRVQEKTAEVAQWKQQVAIKHNQTAVERLRVARILTDTRRDLIALEAELAALERDSAEIEAMWYRLQHTDAARKRYDKVYVGTVGGLPVRGRLTSKFGYRIHPVTGRRRLHTGIDIAAPTGTPIAAAGGGEVIFAGNRGGYGNCVMIDHGRGKWTLYGHMSAISVRNGQVVKGGQMVGKVGSTGISTGPHLHYEVRINGKPVNPL